jgi:Spy/CpxP family protein refolding chaperone
MKIRTRRLVRWTAILAATGAIAAWGIAEAVDGQRGFGGPGPGMFPMMGAMGPMRGLLADLDLTDDQKSQLRAIVRNGWEQSADERVQLEAIRQQIEASVTAGGFNEPEVRALVDSGTPIMASLMVDMIRGMSEMRAVLTPEQQQIFDTRRAEFEARRAERRARRAERHAEPPVDTTGT